MFEPHALEVPAAIAFDGLAVLHSFPEGVLVGVSGMLAGHVSAELPAALEAISAEHTDVPAAPFRGDAFGNCTLHLLHLFSQLQVEALLGSAHRVPLPADDLLGL